MANIYEIFGNKSQEQTGINLDYGDFGFKVARAGGLNKKYMASLNLHGKPYQKATKLGNFDDDKIRAVMAKVYAESIVLGWWGVKDKEGKEMPYNQKNCEQLLSDLPDLFDDIIEQSTLAANFKGKEVEETKKS